MNEQAPHRPARNEPIAVLIAALGGQGGGVLTEWIVHAARVQGLIVQATSTPGVSQRTGATSYYVEIAPAPALGCAPPVLGLAPVPGRVDVLVCAELLEAARMLERGMSTPSRTTVVASTHRVYTTREKMSGADGRFASERIVDAVRLLSRRATLFDMEAIRVRHGSVISAALFGALAGSEALPLSRDACADAIRAAGKGMQASLAAFEEAFALAQARSAGRVVEEELQQTSPAALPTGFAHRVATLPKPVAAMAALGVQELLAYQGARYAAAYVDRVTRIVAAEAGSTASSPSHDVACEAARTLAVWMRYDDLIRVAQCKARASRLARIRSQSGARDADIVRVHDLFRPGARELADILPVPLGAWLERRMLASQARAADRNRTRRVAGRRLTLQTSSVTGALALRALAALRPLRPHSLRFRREQCAISDWIDAIEEAFAGRANGAAIDVARMPRLVRGYGATHAAGCADYTRILAAWRTQSRMDPHAAASALRERIEAALAEAGCAPPRDAAATQPVSDAPARPPCAGLLAGDAR